MFTKNELTDLIWRKLLKIMFFGRKDTLRQLGWFFGTVWEFCWLVTLLNLADRYVFTIVFLFNGEGLEPELYSVHCIGNGLQNSRCKIVEGKVLSNFLKLQGNE